MSTAGKTAPLVARDGVVGDLAFDFWRARLEECEVEALLEWEVCRRYLIPLLGGVKLKRLTAKLLRAWALLLSESIGEREARLARLVVANILVWAGVDVRKTRALLDLPLPCRDTPQGQ